MNRVALVTGASSGIGEATVKLLLKKRYIVYAAARRLDRMSKLKDAGAKLLALDLTDDASIVACMDAIRMESGRIDVLINNAGYGSYGALEDVPMDEARRQFEVNLFGAARLCQLAMPMMREQKYGKIINVSSVGGSFGEPFGVWYHATKYALEGLSDSLRQEMRPFGVDVVIIQPGAIRTEWGGIAASSLLQYSGDTAYGRYARKHAQALGSVESSGLPSPPEKVARIILRSIKARRPKTRYAAGGGAPLFLFMTRWLSDRMLDRVVWRMLQSS